MALFLDRNVINEQIEINSMQKTRALAWLWKRKHYHSNQITYHFKYIWSPTTYNLRIMKLQTYQNSMS